ASACRGTTTSARSNDSVTADLRQRRRVLFAMLTTLGFRYLPGREPLVIAGIRQYFGGWPCVGRIVAGMARQQYDLRLTRYGGHRWEAAFYPGGIGHSLTPIGGTGGRRSRRRPCCARRRRGCGGAGGR